METSLSLSVRQVPFFNYGLLFTSQEEELVGIFREVGRRGAFIDQKDLKDFEKRLCDFTGARFALGVANGTDALIIALKAAGLSKGDEVIFSSHTFVATAASIVHAGGVPVAVECGKDHMIDPASVERAITPKTRAILPTQLNGRTCDMDRLQALADKHGLFIIEDAAQGLGSKFKGKSAGTFGLAGTISFYPAKNLGSLGDGGAILTNDEKMYEKMSWMRDHGRDPKLNQVVVWGFNSRLDNLQAAILDFKLKRYDEAIHRRREIASLYHEYLSGLKELTLPPAPGSEANHFDVFQNYEIEAERRDELKEFLKSKGVGTLIQWGGTAVHQFKELGLNASLPYTEKLFMRLLMLPLHNLLKDEEVKYVCQVIRDFYRP